MALELGLHLVLVVEVLLQVLLLLLEVVMGGQLLVGPGIATTNATTDSGGNASCGLLALNARRDGWGNGLREVLARVGLGGHGGGHQGEVLSGGRGDWRAQGEVLGVGGELGEVLGGDERVGGHQIGRRGGRHLHGHAKAVHHNHNLSPLLVSERGEVGAGGGRGVTKAGGSPPLELGFGHVGLGVRKGGGGLHEVGGQTRGLLGNGIDNRKGGDINELV